MSKKTNKLFDITIDYVSVLDGLTLKEKNDKFNALDDQSQRMEIAWDCLKLIQFGTIEASTGCYWGYELKEYAENCDTSQQLQKALNNTKKISELNCEVCARGGMMLSQIRLGNSIDPSDSSKDDGNQDIIKGFSFKCFKEMEDQYEINAHNDIYYTNTEENLGNICCNILVNGDYNKKDTTNYLTNVKNKDAYYNEDRD